MKSRSWKKTGIILAVLTGVSIAAALIIPKLLDPNRYKGLIASELEKAMGGKVNLGHITWGFKRGFWLEGDGLTSREPLSFAAMQTCLAFTPSYLFFPF